MLYFKDPRFVKKNLDKAAATHVILNKDHSVYSAGIINLHGIDNSFDPSIEFTGKVNSLNDSDHVQISEIFHCDGLLLCTTIYLRLIVVWNPCTGQTRRIRPSNRNTYGHKYVLGYENNNKSCCSYKILSFSFSFKEQNIQVDVAEVYESNSDSWRVLEETYNWCHWFKLSRGVSLKGNTYWFDEYNIDHPTQKYYSILMFDFTTERHGYLSLPFQSDYAAKETVVLSLVREKKLALLHQRFDIDSLVMKIWVTNTKIDEGEELSWSEFLVVKVMMKPSMRDVSFLVDEENRMVMCCDTYKDDEDDKKRGSEFTLLERICIKKFIKRLEMVRIYIVSIATSPRLCSKFGSHSGSNRRQMKSRFIYFVTLK